MADLSDVLELSGEWTQPGRPGRWLHTKTLRVLETQYAKDEGTVKIMNADRTLFWQTRGREERVFEETIAVITSMPV